MTRSPRGLSGPDNWHLIIPIKDPSRGKSRLAASLGLGSIGRAVLNRAIAEDSVAAAAEAVGPDHLILVTGDAELARRWGARGARTLTDPGAGLNAAIRAGLETAADEAAVGVLLGDLPSLRAPDLAEALHAASLHAQAFVPDADGIGTVLRCRAAGAPMFIPRFGPSSAALHEADGATRLALDLPRLRTDVDDASSLGVATVLGLGPRTLSALAAQPL